MPTHFGATALVLPRMPVPGSAPSPCQLSSRSPFGPPLPWFPLQISGLMGLCGPAQHPQSCADLMGHQGPPSDTSPDDSTLTGAGLYFSLGSKSLGSRGMWSCD